MNAAITKTTNGAVLKNNSTSLSLPEPHTISTNHQTSHMSLEEATTTSVAGNLQSQYLTEGVNFRYFMYQLLLHSYICRLKCIL